MRLLTYTLITALFLLCFVYEPLSGQVPLRNFYFKHIKTDQGLTNGVIWSMMKDRDGYLWIGTYNGLNCFDGYHVKTWKADPSSKNKLNNNSIQGICEDHKGVIWVTTDLGVSRYDKAKNIFENYKLFNTSKGKEEYGGTYRIISCRNGAVVTHNAEGIYIFDSLQHNFIYYHGQNKNDTVGFNRINRNSIIEDPVNDGIWIATTSGMWYFDLHKKEFYAKSYNPQNRNIFDDHEITAIFLDRQNQLFYCDADLQQIICYDLVNDKKRVVQSTAQWREGGIWINSLLVDGDNNLWISTFDNMLFFVDGKSQKPYTFKNQIENNYSIIGNNFWSFLEEDDGTIYLGVVNGISYTNIRQNFFSIHRFPDGIQHNLHYQIPMLLNCDFQGNVWMAPSNEFVLKCNPEKDTCIKYDFLPYHLAFDNSPIKITTMAATADTLFFGTMDGIYLYLVKKDVFQKLGDFPPSAGLEGKYILTMCLAKNGDLWFTSHHNGLFRYNIKSRKYKHYLYNEKDSSSYTNNYIFDIHEDLKGDIWIMSEFTGLIKYNPLNDNFIYLMRDAATTLPKEIYTTVVHDEENNLWLLNFVTGITRYNPRTNEVKIMPASTGLSNLLYKEFMMDKDYNLWLGTYYQYSVLNTKKLSALNFDIDYGKNTAEYANHFALRHDGSVVSESDNGYILFNPRYQTFHGQLQPINISNFVAGDSVIPFVNPFSKINLSYSQNFFSFDFSTLSCLKNPNVKFAYKLEGIDKDWVYCNARQTVYYTNVGGGDYTLRVKATNGNGTWLESNTPVKISISKIFYATNWFKLILFILFIILVYWYYRLWKAKDSREKAEQVIAYFANSVSGKNKVEEILWDITHNVIGRSDFVDCVVYLYDENKKILVQKAAYGKKNPGAYQILNPIEIPLGEGIVGNVAKTGIAEIVNDTTKDKRYIADDEARLSELAVPIQYEGKLIGVIDSEHHRKNFFTAEHLELMTTIASISGTKIVNAQKEIEIAENEKRLNELKLQMAHTRQQALRAQMNPHFIFNCLNSINGFILQNDANTASTFLIKFSKLIRLILEHSNEKQITLQSELDALKLYIEMEMLRFEKNFYYEINVDAQLMTDTVMVPPLIFQPFVENSIWHGLLHKETAGTLRINLTRVSDNLVCEITDNGIGRQKSAELKSKSTTQKKSLGLKLTMERLALLKEQENRNSSIEVTDLKNDNETIAGTRVIINLEICDKI